jgi:hypothetical protein
MLKNIMPYAVELDGKLIHCQKGRLTTLGDLRQIKGHCRVVSDFENAIARTMTVEADTRYVELMISRKLQETGEFDEPVTVISHWKKKHGKNTTDIFFTALPSKQYYRYMELVAEQGDHLVVLPIQSLLYTMLRKYGKKEPVAVVFQHDRFADMLVGTSKKIWYANRVVAFDSSDEQIRTLWETVRSDIDAAGHEHHKPVKRLVTANWIDSGKLPQWSDDNAPELIPVVAQRMVMDQQPMEASLPVLIRETSARHAIASRTDKLFYGAKRVLPYFNMAVLLAAVLLWGSGMWNERQAVEISRKIGTMRQAALEAQRKIPQLSEPVRYEATLALIQTLWSCRNLPTFNQILNDVSQGNDGVLKIENIKANYTDEKVEVKAFGRAVASFENAYKAYQALRYRLQKRGYTIVKQRFDTQINASSFLLHLAKEM